MKHIIVGAGATYGEAIALGHPAELCPPLINNFARKTWENYSPHPFLEAYLNQLGHQDLGADPRELFYQLEETGAANIERFMEFVWNNRNAEFKVSDRPPPGYISGLRITSAGVPDDGRTPAFWDDLLYHGIGNPIAFSMMQCFHENGSGWRSLDLTKSVAARLQPGDLILNLNYDTVFELALEQIGSPFVYAPGIAKNGQLLVCKPHGSLNMVTNEAGFTFGQPGWLGLPQPAGYRSFSGIMPPRLNKRFDQHPTARMIIDAIKHRKPRQVVMWGIGLTDSDADLIALYSNWIRRAGSVDIINPRADVAAKAESLFRRNVRHFSDVASWLTSG
ncbi:hypothetical protein [Tardiphaga sp. 813_E8_N1_3]|uniref:hypothetical protein n=1 Tax=Tardiphaga sp. 813_E8_N1_3 TaxID=3240760 RepID=UPI003F294706